MAKNRKLLEDKIWNITRFSPVLREENWTSDVMVEMKKFKKDIVHAMKVYYCQPVIIRSRNQSMSLGKRMGRS